MLDAEFTYNKHKLTENNAFKENLVVTVNNYYKILVCEIYSLLVKLKTELLSLVSCDIRILLFLSLHSYEFQTLHVTKQRHSRKMYKIIHYFKMYNFIFLFPLKLSFF